MEEKDREILSILVRDARTGPDQIARMIGADTAEVSERIQRLEQSGIIKHYKTIVNWERAGEEKVVAFINVKVTPAREVGFDDIARRIYRYPEVKSVYLISGDSDLRVVVESQTLHQLGTFVAEKLATINGVIGTTTHFMLKRYKEDGDLFVDTEEDSRLIVSP